MLFLIGCLLILACFNLPGAIESKYIAHPYTNILMPLLLLINHITFYIIKEKYKKYGHVVSALMFIAILIYWWPNI